VNVIHRSSTPPDANGNPAESESRECRDDSPFKYPRLPLNLQKAFILQIMKIIAFSDIHNELSGFSEITTQIAASDAVIIAGDITHFGYRRETLRIMEILASLNPNIFAVSGNCDHEEVEQYLKEKGMSISNTVHSTGGYAIAGLNGSLPCPGKTPVEYSETEFTEHIAQIRKLINNEQHTILVTHQPPFNTVTDRVSPGIHVGSHSIRKWIEEMQPLICFTGHIHEGAGIDAIGNTKVVNPGPFRYGRYASATLINGEIVDLDIKKI